MKEIKKARELYENTEIPEELGEMINMELKKSRQAHDANYKKRRITMYTKRIGGVAAATFAMFIAGLNTSSAFALGISNVPLIGTIAQVLTFREYTTTDEDKKVEYDVPGVVISEADVAEKNLTKDINVEIQAKCDEYVEGAVERVKEYKDAFISTGGTEEEFSQKGITITVDYEIKNQTKDYISFVVSGNESWVSAYSMNKYYNLNADTLAVVSLEDLLGSDYINKANSSIKAQMSEQMKNDSSISYWGADENGFETISDAVNFYINAEGKPVIVFDKYEVAPGYMGMPEFVIE